MIMITLLQLREFSMIMLIQAAIFRIRKGISFNWNLSPYKARDSIMQRVTKKILNSLTKTITSIVLVKSAETTNILAMKGVCQQ
jgi:hypothetical protein